MTSSSWYRRNVWALKGNREYTKAAFEAACLRFEGKDLEVDCSDRHFMITGANSGIGLATAIEIAKRGGILHLVCRNAKSMKEARSHIITTTGNDRIYQHQVNLTKPAEVAKWAKEFTESYGRLDVLIHNAGVLVHEREVDEDNNETMFAINVLAVHLITLILLPVLRRSNDPRVIIVSSAGMLTVRLDSSDLNYEKMNPFIGRLAYSQTKRRQVIMNFAYAQRYDRVRFYSMHPGWVDTPGVRKALPEFYEQMKDKLRTPLQGADTIIWLAVSQAALKHSSGLFFQDRVPTTTHLPLAWTRTSDAEEQQFMTSLDKLFVQYSSMDPGHIPKPFSHPDRVEINGEQESVLCHPSDSEYESTSQTNVVCEGAGIVENVDRSDENIDPTLVQDRSDVICDDKNQNIVQDDFEHSSTEYNHIAGQIFDDHSSRHSLNEIESEFTESSQLEKHSQTLLNEDNSTETSASQTASVSHSEEIISSLTSENQESLPVPVEVRESNAVSHSDNTVDSNNDEGLSNDPTVKEETRIKVMVAEEAINFEVKDEVNGPPNSETSIKFNLPPKNEVNSNRSSDLPI